MPDPAAPDWAPVATAAVGTWGQVSAPVQIAVIVAAAVVVLVAILAAVWLRRQTSPGATVPAELMLTFTHEMSAQLGALKEVTEGLAEVIHDLKSTITGCQTCPWLPTNSKRKGEHHDHP